MTEVTLPISKLPDFSLSANTKDVSIPVVDNAQTKKMNLGQLISYINTKNSSANTQLTFNVLKGSGMQINGQNALESNTQVTLALSDVAYTISDNITYSLAKTANTTATSAKADASSAFTKANLAIENAAEAKNVADAAQSSINAHKGHIYVGTSLTHPLVTTNGHGFMSSDDKANLNSVMAKGGGNVTINVGNGLAITPTNSSNNFMITANTATTTKAGIVQLSSSLTDTSEIIAATALAVNNLNEKIDLLNFFDTSIPNCIKIPLKTPVGDIKGYIVQFGNEKMNNYDTTYTATSFNHIDLKHEMNILSCTATISKYFLLPDTNFLLPDTISDTSDPPNLVVRTKFLSGQKSTKFTVQATSVKTFKENEQKEDISINHYISYFVIGTYGLGYRALP